MSEQEPSVDRDGALEILTESGAMLKGHFLLSSGRHSERYLQCAQVQQYPDKLAMLCAALAGLWKKERPTVVLGPAMGGIVIAYELARQLKARAMFMERTENGFELRRGFRLESDDRVLVAEDVVTTGKSVIEVLKVLENVDCSVVGVTSLICRDSAVDFGIRYQALLTLEVPSFTAQDCPLCKTGSVAVKPGSRPQPARES